MDKFTWEDQEPTYDLKWNNDVDDTYSIRLLGAENVHFGDLGIRHTLLHDVPFQFASNPYKDLVDDWIVDVCFYTLISMPVVRWYLDEVGIIPNSSGEYSDTWVELIPDEQQDLGFHPVLARPKRTLKQALRYWYPKRLTLKHNPRVHAWLWWNL